MRLGVLKACIVCIWRACAQGEGADSGGMRPPRRLPLPLRPHEWAVLHGSWSAALAAAFNAQWGALVGGMLLLPR